ncbi:Cyclin-dependent kinase 11B [Echinococcus granulosus]|uniref:cyclin-dependent kinase n=1 Tax=Echinococcus granulosus TaxID=6210 RepID=A0A068WR16_ECHGR|nr:Cyclin-dependent kinase 11B [Echinococcus granulosus]CDS20922.1 cyclin dependent kinase 11B [Echinococcus granulosus]
MSRDEHQKSSKRNSKEHTKYHAEEEEGFNYDEVDEIVPASNYSPREEGEAFSEEGEASSDENTGAVTTEQQEREYRSRLTRRKAEREAEAAAAATAMAKSNAAHLPPRSKFDSPERSVDDRDVLLEKPDIHSSIGTGAFQNLTSSSSSDSSNERRSLKRGYDQQRIEVLGKKPNNSITVSVTTSSRHNRRHHHHRQSSRRSHQKSSESQSNLHKHAISISADEVKKSYHSSESPIPLSSGRNRSRSPPRDREGVEAKADTYITPPPPLEPSGLNTRLASGRAPIIDGSHLKYLEEEEEDEDEIYSEEGAALKANGDEGKGVETSGELQLDRAPPKPFYFPSIQGCRSVDEFECLNRIEEGTYGVVYRARDKRTNEVVALKRLKMEKEREGFPITSLREINTLMKAQHENIVTVREIVVGFDLDKIYLVMEYVEHDLKSLMEIMSGPFTVGQVKCLLIQLLRAVQHLHDNWILHRDLKTSNLLLSHKGILKVGDFGLAREYGSPLQHYTEVVVTLWYRAVELLLGSKSYSTPIDLWSVGCIFAEFLLQRPLFPGKGEVDQINMIFRDLGTPNERIWPGVTQLPGMRNGVFTEYPYNQLRRRFTEKQISGLGFELLTNFLTYCPERRITAEKALSHRYFTERPQAIHPSMMPSWPAKSEGGGRPSQSSHRPASPRPPPGATGSLREPPAPLGASLFFAAASKRTPSRNTATSGGSGIRGSGPDHGFLLRF